MTTIRKFIPLPRSLQNLSTLNHPDEDHDDRDDEENVDESAHGVRGDQAQYPENEQDERYSPEHVVSPLRAAPAANAGAYDQQHTADYCARAAPGGNRALPFGGDLHIADSQNAPLRTVAQAPEHNEGAEHDQ